MASGICSHFRFQPRIHLHVRYDEREHVTWRISYKVSGICEAPVVSVSGGATQHDHNPVSDPDESRVGGPQRGLDSSGSGGHGTTEEQARKLHIHQRTNLKSGGSGEQTLGLPFRICNNVTMNRGPLSNAQSNCELGSFGMLTEVYRSLIGRRRNKEAKLEGSESKRSASVSPRTARRKFFEEYPFEPGKQSRDRSQMTAGGHFDTDELQSGFLIGSISSESVDMRKRSKDPLTGKKLTKNATGKDKETSANRHLLDRFSSTLPFFKKKKSSYLEISLCEDTTPSNEPLYPSESMTSHFEGSDYSIRQMEADSSVSKSFKSNSLKRSGNCQIPVAASRPSSGRRADHVIGPVPQQAGQKEKHSSKLFKFTDPLKRLRKVEPEAAKVSPGTSTSLPSLVHNSCTVNKTLSPSGEKKLPKSETEQKRKKKYFF